LFKTVISDKAFIKGLHYWVLKVDDKTTGEFKIGVTCTKNDSFVNGAFCDIDDGFAFYSPGLLRNGSNAKGSNYGKKLVKGSVIEVFFKYE